MVSEGILQGINPVPVEELVKSWEANLSQEKQADVSTYTGQVSVYRLGAVLEAVKPQSNLGLLARLGEAVGLGSITKREVNPQLLIRDERGIYVTEFGRRQDPSLEGVVPVFQPIGENVGVYWVDPDYFLDSCGGNRFAELVAVSTIEHMVGDKREDMNLKFVKREIEFLGYRPIDPPQRLGFAVNRKFNAIVGEFPFNVSFVMKDLNYGK